MTADTASVALLAKGFASLAIDILTSRRIVPFPGRSRPTRPQVLLRRKPPAPPPEMQRQIRKVRAMLADEGLPDGYAEAILKQMCSHLNRFLLQWA